MEAARSLAREPIRRRSRVFRNREARDCASALPADRHDPNRRTRSPLHEEREKNGARWLPAFWILGTHRRKSAAKVPRSVVGPPEPAKPCPGAVSVDRLVLLRCLDPAPYTAVGAPLFALTLEVGCAEVCVRFRKRRGARLTLRPRAYPIEREHAVVDAGPSLRPSASRRRGLCPSRGKCSRFSLCAGRCTDRGAVRIVRVVGWRRIPNALVDVVDDDPLVA